MRHLIWVSIICSDLSVLTLSVIMVYVKLEFLLCSIDYHRDCISFSLPDLSIGRMWHLKWPYTVCPGLSVLILRIFMVYVKT